MTLALFLLVVALVWWILCGGQPGDPDGLA